MQIGGFLGGGAPVLKKFKLGASVANAGIPVIVDASNDFGECIPCTTTSFADTWGLAVDTGTYTTTQAATEGVVTVCINPDLIVRALLSGGATEGTALQALITTSASAGGTTITDADVGTATSVAGTCWCASGNNVGQSRIITTFNSAVSIVVTVPFPRAIATTDTYHQCPFSRNGSAGSGNAQTTTLFTQVDASIVAGTGGEVAIVDLELNGASDSYVLFVLADHALKVVTV